MNECKYVTGDSVRTSRHCDGSSNRQQGLPLTSWWWWWSSDGLFFICDMLSRDCIRVGFRRVEARPGQWLCGGESAAERVRAISIYAHMMFESDGAVWAILDGLWWFLQS
jgi:hypothetical protein